jgi:hypothetical protein
VNKVDYYMQRDIDTEVELEADGSAEVTVTATLQNTTPAGLSSVLVGPNVAGDPAGLNRMLLSFLLPESAQQVEMDVGGGTGELQQWAEDTYPVHSTVLEILPGDRATVTVKYVLSGAFDPTVPSTSFELVLLPQTLVNPDTYSLLVTPPAGWGIVEVHNAVLEGARVVAQGTLLDDSVVRIDLNQAP